MSLKARLRLAVALLMSVMVAVLSGLYIKSYLETALQNTEDIATRIGNQVQSTVREELQRSVAEAPTPPSVNDDQYWVGAVRDNRLLMAALRNTMNYWGMVNDVFITDNSGAVLLSSLGPTTKTGNLPLLSDWEERPFHENLKQIFVDQSDTEVLRPITVLGSHQPVLTVHIVISWRFISDSLRKGLRGLIWIAGASLLASVILALALPNVVLDPLERLNRRLDLIATGKYTASPGGEKPETTEFASIFTKLNVLGEQFKGAQDNVLQLRGNVEQLVDRLESTVMLFDSAGRLSAAGTAVRYLLRFNPTDIVGRHVSELFPPHTEIGEIVVPAVEAGEFLDECVLPFNSGTRPLSLLVTVQPLRRSTDPQAVGTLITLRDADSRGELAAQLDVASRLAALSQLTRGVAHEIKNPLNAMRLHLEVLRSRLEEDPPELSVIAGEISRLDRVVKTFLDFNQPVEPHMRPLDMNELVAAISQLITPEASSRAVDVIVRPAHRPAIFNADLDLIKQAILNVVMNGVEAMQDGGRLTLETRVGGGVVELTVTDTGPGIPADLQDKIFNLYFTTKDSGSGIGLAVAFRFVQLHDGKIEVSSQIGSGTTFRFSFPEAASTPTQPDIGMSRTHRA
jgi:signal transduction histidine kinase